MFGLRWLIPPRCPSGLPHLVKGKVAKLQGGITICEHQQCRTALTNLAISVGNAAANRLEEIDALLQYIPALKDMKGTTAERVRKLVQMTLEKEQECSKL